MNPGTLYGIGVGPGDPELLTLKAVRLLGECSCIYVPTSQFTRQGYVADVAREYVRPQAEIREVEFSLSPDMAERRRHWDEPAADIASLLAAGENVGFVTLGDPLVYSTYIYLLRALKKQMPKAQIVTVPGITSFSTCAALTSFPLGEGKEPLTVVPMVEDLAEVERAIETGGTIVLMKIGRRLQTILDLLERKGHLEDAVFVARAGLPEQHVETDLRKLQGLPDETGNLAVILIHSTGRRA